MLDGAPDQRSPRDTAISYIDRGWSPIPVPFREKGPRTKRWHNLHIDRSNVDHYFPDRLSNVGVILGAASEGLTDVDLDCVESERIAGRFVPHTGAVFGRSSKPRSHYLYSSDLSRSAPKAVVQFADPTDKTVLLELRIGGRSGAQTVFPGSVHSSGEPVVWASHGDPEPVGGADLKRACETLAAASLLARHWGRPGDRNDYRMALTGWLIRAGWTDQEIAECVDAVTVAAGGEADPEQHENNARSTRARFETGDAGIYGFAKLAELVGENVARQAAKWLRIPAAQSAPERVQTSAAGAVEETEDGVACEFVQRHHDHVRFDHSVGAWSIYAGDHWREDKQRSVLEHFRVVAREACRGAAKGTLSKRFITGAEGLARTDRRVAVSGDHWDADPWLLGAPGVTIDLRTGEVRAPIPADMITKRAAVAPAETAHCPRWLEFIDEATGGDHELQRFLSQWVGYCLTGDVSEQVLVFLLGPGGTGKSLFINTLSEMLGDYASVARAELFAEKNFDDHPTEIAAFRGARLVTANELKRGRSWDEARVKSLTGGDRINARRMRQDPFTFSATFKIMLSGNHAPPLDVRDSGMERRLIVVPFEQTPKAVDHQLHQKLRQEFSGILRWALDGLADWRENGLIRPESAVKSTSEYFADADVVGQWLEDCCECDLCDRELFELRGALMDSYSDYARRVGPPTSTARDFYAELERRGFVRIDKKIAGKKERCFGGLKLRAEETP